MYSKALLDKKEYEQNIHKAEPEKKDIKETAKDDNKYNDKANKDETKKEELYNIEDEQEQNAEKLSA